MGKFNAGNKQSPNRTPNEVAVAIRRDRLGGMTYGQLAIKYDVHPNTAMRICNMQSHRDVALVQAEKTDAQLLTEGQALERKLFLTNGWEMPEHLKTQAEREIEAKVKKTDEQLTELMGK